MVDISIKTYKIVDNSGTLRLNEKHTRMIRS